MRLFLSGNCGKSPAMLPVIRRSAASTTALYVGILYSSRRQLQRLGKETAERLLDSKRPETDGKYHKSRNDRRCHLCRYRCCRKTNGDHLGTFSSLSPAPQTCRIMEYLISGLSRGENKNPLFLCRKFGSNGNRLQYLGKTLLVSLVVINLAISLITRSVIC